MTEVEAALARVEAQLGSADYQLFRRLVNTLLAATAIVNSSRAMLSRLRRLFGLQSSERSRDILGDQGSDSAAAAEDDSSVTDEETDDSSDVSQAASDDAQQPPSEPRKGHGRLPASVYKAATHIAVSHQTLKSGDKCPDCPGKLYELREPAQYLRIFGQPVLRGTCWDCQRLRCGSCGHVYTARPPPEAQGPKFDETAVAMIALCRYSLGLPHHRLERMQKHLKLPVPSSTQWDLIAENAAAFEPVFTELERHAASSCTMTTPMLACWRSWVNAAPSFCGPVSCPRPTALDCSPRELSPSPTSNPSCCSTLGANTPARISPHCSKLAMTTESHRH